MRVPCWAKWVVDARQANNSEAGQLKTVELAEFGRGRPTLRVEDPSTPMSTLSDTACSFMKSTRP